MNESYIKEIIKELTEENLAIFAGAGFSVPAGFVTWPELLRPISEELGLNIEKETDLLSLAQYHCNDNSANRHVLSKRIIEEFSHSAKPTKNHAIISKLPIREYWTTNYDKLIEISLQNNGRNPDVKYTNEQLANTKPKRDCTVYKMHGDVEHPDKAILTKDDYESYHQSHSPFITALSGSLVNKTFLFIGFSFTDPNLDYILSRIRILYSNHQRRHFCFQRKVNKKSYKSTEEFSYAQLKQEYFIKDLGRFNIKTILIDEYEEITDILEKISNNYRRKTIFISGAAAEYGLWNTEEAYKLMHNLSQSIIKREYRIVSGFGLGVGSFIISGALEEIYLNSTNISKDNLVLKPFPQNSVGTMPLPDLWNKYRRSMCEYSGVAIFLFGNKIINGNIQISDGMNKEFEIAKEANLFIIPIGSTGYASEKIYREIENNIENFGYNTQNLKEQFSILGKEYNVEKIVESILSILNEITH